MGRNRTDSDPRGGSGSPPNGEDVGTTKPTAARGSATDAPRVSVVLPTYQRPAFLDRAVATVQAQTLTDWELIVVDDNDPLHPDRHRTLARLAAYARDPRIRVVLHASNRGGGAARNTGIRNAHAPWIAFLDDDDEWDPTKLERQVAYAEGVADDVAVVYCRIQAHHAATGQVSIYQSEPEKCTTRDLLVRNHIGGTSCIMARAEALLEVGMFDEGLASRQDIDLYVRLIQTYRFAFLDAPLVTMHLHDTPRISTNAAAKAEGHRAFFEKHRQLIEVDRLALHARLKELGRYLLAADELREARRVLARAWRLDVRDEVVLRRLLLTYPTVRSVRNALRFKLGQRGSARPSGTGTYGD